MFCNSCGAAMADDAKFCPLCGTAISVPEQPVYQQPVQPVYQQPVYQQPAQPGYQQPAQPGYQQYDPAAYQQPVQPGYQQPAQVIYQPVEQIPMKWFKFLIYFALFAGAILNASNGLQLFNGMIYGGSEEAAVVYAFFEGLETLDMIIGIAMIGLAIFAIVARIRLAGYYKNGPKMLIAYYIASIAVSLIYALGVSSIVSTSVLGDTLTSYYSSVAMSIAMAGANYTYFKKRAHLFTK